MSHCKSCSRAKTYRWREKNKEKWNAYINARYAALSPEAKAASLAKGRLTPSRVARDERRRLAKLSRVKLTPHDYEQLPHIKAYRRAYRATPERLAVAREYQKTEHAKALRKAREKWLRENDPAHKLRNAISIGVRSQIRKGGKSAIKPLPYTPDDLRAHLERQFTRGMTWQNYGTYWEIDHIVPKSAFNISALGDAEHLACWALTNLRPLERIENRKKNAKRIYLL